MAGFFYMMWPMRFSVIRLRRAVFSAAVFLVLPLAAQEPAVLSSEVRVVSLMPHLSILRDPSGSLAFEQIRDPEVAARFQPNRAERLHYGFTQDGFWVRFRLQSAADRPMEWFVELAHTRFDHLDWFAVRDGNVTESFEAGNLRPRDPAAVHSRLPVWSVRLDAGETVDVYLRLQTRMVVRIPLKIYSAAAYAERTDRAGMVYLFCLGAFSVLCVMGMIFAAFTRYRGSLAYSLSIAGVILIYFGLSGYWSYLELPGWRFGVTNGLIYFNQLCMIALLIYLRGFFSLAETMPKTDRVLLFLQRGCVLFLFFIPFGPYPPLMKLVQLEILLFGGLAMTIALIRFFRGDRTARFYLLAWFSFWGLLLLDILQQWKIFPPPATPDLPALIALAVSYTLFFMSMADRVREMREEKELLQKEMTSRLEQLVTERTEGLRLAKEEAEQANRYKGLFLANMSHEIRTPLSALVGLSQAMCRQSDQYDLPKDFTRFLEQIRSGGQYLNLILTNLLDVSSAETGKVRVNRCAVNLSDWSRSVHHVLQPIAEVKGVHLGWDDRSLQGKTDVTDPVRLSQIVLNLVHNAIKFTPPGKQVSVKFEVCAQRIVFSVEDEGPGIPDEEKEAVFSAFEQSRTTVSGLDQGVGLGLHVVQTNAALLGCAVCSENRTEGGARFRVEWSQT